MDFTFDLSKIRLIVGLGNIGRVYIGTRHNVGFDLVERLASTSKFVEEKKMKAYIYQGSILENRIIFAEPNTMMNSSGEAVSLIMNFYKIDPSEILVIHDDLDLSIGKYKLQFGKGPKVHNGINSIENRIGTTKFWRLRVGVDNRDLETRRNMAGADYVLGAFKVDEVKTLNEMYESLFNEIIKQPILEKETNE